MYPSSWHPTLDDQPSLLTVEDIQKYLNRSRASVYRYANTNPEVLNPPYDAKKLNPEVRRDKDDPLQFRPQEVQRFAEEVLGLNPTIEVQTPAENLTNALLGEILQELQAIHRLLELQSKD
ncbi:MAG: resolvase [Cyanobacteria bacterium REEB459]|nr:resolvase [Cyanobacteria bacterium REEB459]